MSELRRLGAIRWHKGPVYDVTVVLLLTVIALYGAWLYRDFAQDDAFITYRYARNIAGGHGFVYNLDEPLLGTTTPLYTLFLALLAKVSGLEIRWLSHWVGIFSLWLSAVLLFYIGRDREKHTAAAAALIFISNPLLITAIGMETFFLMAVMLLALRSYQLEKFVLTGVLIGLAMLTRYEIALFAAILGAHYFFSRRRLPFWLISTAAIFLAWLAFAWFTFGHVIPRSAVAKLAEVQGYSFAVGALIWWQVYALQSGWYYVLVPLLLLGIYSAGWNRSHQPMYQLILIWTLVYFVAAALTAGTFTWYYGPLIPGLAILLAWGIEQLARFLGKLLGKVRVVDRQQTLQAGALAVITLGIVLLQLTSWSQGWHLYRDQVVDRRYVSYRQVADWLNQHIDGETSLAANEIGVLGYYTDDVTIIDLYGLVTPGLIPWLTFGRAEVLDRAVNMYTPDYVLINGQDLFQVLQSHPEYEPVERFGEGTYVLYVKR